MEKQKLSDYETYGALDTDGRASMVGNKGRLGEETNDSMV